MPQFTFTCAAEDVPAKNDAATGTWEEWDAGDSSVVTGVVDGTGFVTVLGNPSFLRKVADLISAPSDQLAALEAYLDSL